jgi:hypothetical protein
MTSSTANEVTISQRGSEMVIEWRWLDRSYIAATTLNAVLFNLFLGVLFYYGSSLFAFTIDGKLPPSVPVGAVLIATGIALAYDVATDWLNRTVIVVTRTSISVRHGPLPWPGNKVISAIGIKCLHVVVSPWGRKVRGRRIYTAKLVVVAMDGQRTKIAGGFKQPQSVKQAIEKFLSIKSVAPAPPNAADRDLQMLDNFFAGKPIDQPLKNVVLPRASGPATTVTAVLAFWLFTLLWNGLIWRFAWHLESTQGMAGVWDNIGLIAPLGLTGLVLFIWAIPRTIKYFRTRSTTQRNEGWGRKEWLFLTFVVWLAFIAWTFYLAMP